MKACFFVTLLAPPLLPGGGASMLAGAQNLRLGLADPKTISLKTETFGDLKYLFFGTSRSWGVGLEDREREAFPFLLSINATNLAIPAGNSVYPSRCAESMLKPFEDQSFDVIVLESIPSWFAADKRLAQRLHQRFPKAIILLIDMWYGLDFQNKPSGKSLREWAEQEGVRLPELPPVILERSGVDDWSYRTEALYTKSQLEEFEPLGIIISVPRPTHTHDMVQQFSHYLLPDLSHYSKEGHGYITTLILEKLKQINFRTYHDPTIEPWGGHDWCESWFRTGETSLKTNMPMLPFTDGKYTLEATGDTNWISFATTADRPQKVFVQYMVKFPCGKYPGAKLSLSDQHVDVQACTDLPYINPVHVHREVNVGVVMEPGEHILQIKPDHTTDKGIQVSENDDKWPFRITGLLLIPEDAE